MFTVRVISDNNILKFLFADDLVHIEFATRVWQIYPMHGDIRPRTMERRNSRLPRYRKLLDSVPCFVAVTIFRCSHWADHNQKWPVDGHPN